MLRDEYRKACLEAIEYALADAARSVTRPSAQRILDALNGIACVVPAEATNAMLTLAYEEKRRSGNMGPSERVLWRIMSAAGDLTNPPEAQL